MRSNTHTHTIKSIEPTEILKNSKFRSEIQAFVNFCYYHLKPNRYQYRDISFQMIAQMPNKWLFSYRIDPDSSLIQTCSVIEPNEKYRNRRETNMCLQFDEKSSFFLFNAQYSRHMVSYIICDNTFVNEYGKQCFQRKHLEVCVWRKKTRKNFKLHL